MSFNRRHADGRRVSAALGIATALAFLGVLAPSLASAQMYQQNWNFKSRDRAGLAVVMKQAESGMFNRSSSSSAATGSSGSSTLLVCGGGGGGDTASSATANSSCIILNNATGDLSIGQDSQGDQSANATTQSTVDQVQQILDENGAVQTAGE